jgi:hypothetical protein
MEILIVEGDALEISADVLVLKYAQDLYGVDELAFNRLEAAGSQVQGRLPKAGEYSLIDTMGELGSTKVLFVGVVPLRAFDYEAIRAFAKRALASLAEAMPTASHVALTVHGPGYGLDESEAFRSELAGLIDAFESRDCPSGLRRVTIIERDAGRARRLQAQLSALLLAASSAVVASHGQDTRLTSQLEPLQTSGAKSQGKAHVFVAMPFAPEFDDRFHYGIQQAVNSAGYLCERADLATFTGDVIAWVRGRIDSASLLVADLSTANPNVYLEVGYAWGRGIPTVLLAADTGDLCFNVKGQRCLIYQNIRALEGLLTQELKNLR